MNHQQVANMSTAPNIVCDQFIVAAVTGVARGQNAKNQSGVTHTTAAILMKSPYLPSDHLRGGNGAPLSLLHIKQPIVTM